jgi:divalent metal cation (Fe/Co/Zn/Cd) transporter
MASTVLATPAAPVAGDTLRWKQRALLLVWSGVAWGVVEATVGLATGAVTNSTALIAFGFDSIIELAAGGILIWHLRRELSGRDVPENAEHRAHQMVGVTFFALAAFVVVHAALSLTGVLPEAQPSVVGIVLIAASAVVMTVLYFMKTDLATKLGSPALRLEAKQALYCDLQDVPVIVGLVASLAFGWWWADPLVALAIVPLLIREGREGLGGNACGDACA